MTKPVNEEPGRALPTEVNKPDANPQSSRQEAQGHKSTQYDGNPNPQGTSSGALGPKDDTPLTLKKKSGPRNDKP